MRAYTHTGVGLGTPTVSQHNIFDLGGGGGNPQKVSCAPDGIHTRVSAWFPGTAHSTKKGPSKDPKRTSQAYTRTFSLLYGRRFNATRWLSKSKWKWWSNNSIIVACITKNGMVSLDCNMAGVPSASSSDITIRGTATKIQLPLHKILLLGAPTLKCCSQMDFKGPHHNGKDPLTKKKGPMHSCQPMRNEILATEIWRCDAPELTTQSALIECAKHPNMLGGSGGMPPRNFCFPKKQNGAI